MLQNRIFTRWFFAVFIAGAIGFTGCKSTTTTPAAGSYILSYLVSDTAGYGNNVRIDGNLVNAWGIAVGPTGYFWIGANHSSLSTVYNGAGAETHTAVQIPSRTGITGGAPTGVIYNSTTGFKGSKFIFAGEDGTISTWVPDSSRAIRVATSTSATAVYKGIAMAADGANNYLYLTNFKEGKIDVYDNNFSAVPARTIMRPSSIPAAFSPFGISNINGKLYVSFAKNKPAPDNGDDESGAGNGYIVIFNPDGSVNKPFASGGTLNSPWGIVQAPDGFGGFKNDILIGNFGDGMINVYDANGGFLGQLKDNNGNVLTVDGLWAIIFTDTPGNDKNTLYFAAGPNGESHGLFGKIQFK